MKIDIDNQILKGKKPQYANATDLGIGNYEDEMFFTPEQYAEKEENGKRTGYRNLNTARQYWQRRGNYYYVPYTINKRRFAGYERANIAAAIGEYHRKTCLR